MASSTLSKILLAPWRYYTQFAGFTFTAVVGTNLCTTVVDKNRRSLLSRYPSVITAAAVGKGLIYAPLWPAWYMTMAILPKSAFYLGGGTIADNIISNLIGPVLNNDERVVKALAIGPSITLDDKALTISFPLDSADD